jgi:hypothetical protein
MNTHHKPMPHHRASLPRPMYTQRGWLMMATLPMACAAALAQAPAPEIEPAAMAALSAMGKELRSLKSFGLHVETTTDEVLSTGQKVQFAGTADYSVRAPNGLRVDLTSDHKRRQYFYNGKSVTQYAPKPKFYVTVPGAGNIAETLELIEQKYGIDIPLSDLFFWGTDKAGTADIKQASFIGATRLGERECNHYAYRQDGVDWQVWIRSGKSPLPCKLLITTTSDAAQPQYTATMTWKPQQRFPASTFEFVAPKGAHPIKIASQ